MGLAPIRRKAITLTDADLLSIEPVWQQTSIKFE